MQLFPNCKKKYLFILGLIICICLFANCFNNKSTDKIKNNYEKFAGSQSCKSCHKNIYDTHIKTAHFKTSANATATNIVGSFDSGKNYYRYLDGNYIKMEKRGDSFFQVAYINGIEKRSQHFDMVIGSGTKGQSYGAWVNTKLVQMPITYFTSKDQWCNSPGYPNKIAYNRPISSRCLECHTTYVEKISEEQDNVELFNKNKMILGVDCEKCHGAAQQHVDYQTQHPNETIAKFIINPSKFTRQQSLDLCTLCHGGKLQKTLPSFSFSAGNNLLNYFNIDTITKEAFSIDVHGNQTGLLKVSKCFKQTNTLTCVTCHNAHENQKGEKEMFSQKCLNCHNNEHKENPICKLTNSLGERIKKNCIDCHMPEQASMAISVILQGSSLPTPALMHNHNIAIYPEETKKVMAYFNHSN